LSASDQQHRQNLASKVLAVTPRWLSSDFEARWRHPVVAVETFTDPACYKASNLTALGTTSGFERGEDASSTTVPRRPAVAAEGGACLLVSDFDPPAFFGGMKVRAADLNRLDLQSLLDEIAAVPHPRMWAIVPTACKAA